MAGVRAQAQRGFSIGSPRDARPKRRAIVKVNARDPRRAKRREGFIRQAHIGAHGRAAIARQRERVRVRARFQIARVAVVDGCRKQPEDAQNREYDRKARERIVVAPETDAIGDHDGERGAEHQQKRPEQRKPEPVGVRVVPELARREEEYFARGRVFQKRVAEHDALRRPEAGHVRDGGRRSARIVGDQDRRIADARSFG